MRRTGIAVAVVAALGLWLASPASAQYPPPPTCHLSDVHVDAGDHIGISGFNWLPDSGVLLQFFSQPVTLGTAHTDSEGAFSTTEEIPDNASEGQHTIRASGQDLNGDPATVDCGLVVVEAEGAGGGGAGGGGGGGVAFTGTNVSLGLLILGALVIAGLGLVLAGRRRRAHADH
jgi:hypothetical protein